MVESIPNDLSIDELHATLSNTSVELAYLFWEIPREIITHRPTPESWSPLEILVHMRQVGEVYAERVKRVLNSGDSPYFHDFDDQKQMSRIRLEEETVKSNLNEFMKARSELLNQISFIEKEDWENKKCIHEVSGELSLRRLLIPLAQREKKNIKILTDLLGDY